jgi:hypothetical protein
MKNGRTRVMRRPRRVWPPTARSVAATIAAAGLVLLAAACTHSPSSTGSGRSPNSEGSTNSPSALAYSACMRSHGVPNFPDPDSTGQLPKTDAGQLGVSSSQYRSAQQACGHLLPTGRSLKEQEAHCWESNDCSPALLQLMLTADQKLAECIRSHGMPNFPDPTTGSDGQPFFPITTAGIPEDATRTHQFIHTMDACARQIEAGGNAPPPEAFG